MITKKYILFTIIITSVLLLLSCESNKNLNTLIDVDSYKSGVWLDSDTFRISAEGPPSRAMKNVRDRRNSAVRSARRHAQYKVLKKFREITRKSGSKKIKSTYERKKNTKVIIRTIKRGYILKDSIVYDKNDRCRLVYEVKVKNLKYLLNGADLRAIEVIR